MARVLLLLGGTSREREVSLKSGAATGKALRELGHEVTELDVREDFLASLVEVAGEVDVAFISLHGRGGEDGSVQGALELAGLPYTGSGIMASAVAISKAMSKTIFRVEGIPVAEDVAISRNELAGNGLERITQGIGRDLGFPCIVKPDREGSTVGASIARNLDDLARGLQEAFELDELVLVEEYIEGREFTVGILGNEELALPVLEVRSSIGFYDYQSKYTKGMTEYLVPAPIDERLASTMQDLSLRAHRSLHCEGISRVDFMLDAEENIYCLEVNTLPGMTELSLIPKAAAAMGLSFAAVVEKILASARLKMT
jgi:D-alanine-D-alanine ligase